MTFQSDLLPPLDYLTGAYSDSTASCVDVRSSLRTIGYNGDIQNKLPKRNGRDHDKWEDDGGAVELPVSPLQGHIEKAERLLSGRDYNAAVAEYKNAAARYEDYRENIKSSINQAIRQLSTMGNPAAPPHPKAIDLVRLQKQILA